MINIYLTIVLIIVPNLLQFNMKIIVFQMQTNIFLLQSSFGNLK